MQESQAGEKSPSPPQNKFPWEAGFWGEVGGVINQVYTGIKEAINPPPKDPPVIEPWDARFWRGNVKTNPPPTANFQGYLKRLASAESSDNPSKKAQTSTASGLFQFTERTWMEAVSKLGLPFTLNDRFDPKKSQQVVEATTLKNYERAKNELGRNPNQTELYMYHFLGAWGATKFLKADPDTKASDVVSPAALKANGSVFKNKTVRDVLEMFHPKFGREEVVIDDSVRAEGVLERSPKRIARELSSTFKVEKLLKSPLSTVAGRNSFVDSLQKEWERIPKGVKAETYGNSSINYFKINHPEKYTEFMFFHNADIDGFSQRELDHLAHHKDFKISWGRDLGTTRGFVYAEGADRVFLNPAMADKATLIHELEHIKQQRLEGKYKHTASTSFEVNAYKNPGRASLVEMKNFLQKQKDNPSVEEVFRSANAFEDSHEFLANIEAYRISRMKDGIAWKDTPLFKVLEKEFGRDKAFTMVTNALMASQGRSALFNVSGVPGLPDKSDRLAEELKGTK